MKISLPWTVRWADLFQWFLSCWKQKICNEPFSEHWVIRFLGLEKQFFLNHKIGHIIVIIQTPSFYADSRNDLIWVTKCMKESYKCNFVFIAFWWFYLLRYSSLLFEIIVLIFYTNNDLYKENFTYHRTVFAYMYEHVPQSLKKLVKNINNSLSFWFFSQLYI